MIKKNIAFQLKPGISCETEWYFPSKNYFPRESVAEQISNSFRGNISYLTQMIKIYCYFQINFDKNLNLLNYDEIIEINFTLFHFLMKLFLVLTLL